MITEDKRDELRHDFLQKLAAASLNLSDWEPHFPNQNCGLTRFTDRQRFVVDNLIKKYSAQLPLRKSARVDSRRARPQRISSERAGELFSEAKRKEGL
jgi:hypothetical protein